MYVSTLFFNGIISHAVCVPLGRKAGFSIRAMTRMATLAGAHTPELAQLREDVQQFKAESERVRCCSPVLFLNVD